MALFKYRFTKKNLKIINFSFDWSVISIPQFKKKLPTVSRAASLRNLYKFYILNKRFLKKLYGDLKNNKFKKIHKHSFKKRKHRFYFQNFFYNLERRACTLLFQVRIVSKVRYMKQLVLHKHLYINGLLRKGYSTELNPLDFIYLKVPVLTLKDNRFFSNDIWFKHSINGVFDRISKFFILRVYKRFYLYKRACNKFYFFKLRRRYAFLLKEKFSNLLSFFFYLVESLLIRFFFYLVKKYFLKYTSWIIFSYNLNFKHRLVNLILIIYKFVFFFLKSALIFYFNFLFNFYINTLNIFDFVFNLYIHIYGVNNPYKDKILFFILRDNKKGI